jgi:hypothetical protein
VFALVLVGVMVHPLWADDQVGLVDVRMTSEVSTTRPAALLPLYASLTGLQIYSGVTTMTLNNRYGSENAAMGGLNGTPAALWSVKAGVTAYSILVSEQLWRQGRRKRAVTVLVIANAVQAFVAARNLSALSQAP